MQHIKVPHKIMHRPLNYVTHQLPSVQHKAQAASHNVSTQSSKKRISQEEKEQRDINKYLRKRLAWCNQGSHQFDESKEQYSLLPRSLSKIDGTPHKGNKSKWTNKLEARYTYTDSPFGTTLDWTKQVAIIQETSSRCVVFHLFFSRNGLIIRCIFRSNGVGQNLHRSTQFFQPRKLTRCIFVNPIRRQVKCKVKKRTL